MNLRLRHRRSLRAIERNLADSDPSLTKLFSAFTDRAPGEERGRAENVKARPLRALARRLAVNVEVICIDVRSTVHGAAGATCLMARSCVIAAARIVAAPRRAVAGCLSNRAGRPVIGVWSRVCGGRRGSGVGDLVGEQGVDLGGLGGGVAQAAAHDLDGDAAFSSVACAWRSWWMPIAVPRRRSTSSAGCAPRRRTADRRRPLMLARNSGPEVYPDRARYSLSSAT